jgi:predicted AAA+ superfamily ATPase
VQAGLPPNANALAGLVDRRIERVALERMNEEPVLALQGPRAVGKTTLLKGLARARNASVIDLDDLATREAVADDPATFVSGSAPVLIDEYQHVPVVLDAIKAELNKDSSPGRFVITGSTRYDALPMAARTLTGRLHLLTVLPLAQVELARDRGELLRMLFDDPLALVTSKASSTSREEYAERIVAGGFPPALQRATRAARGRWFDDYLWLCLERDAAELARIQMRSALPELLARLAAQTGQVLNVTAAGASAGLGKRTADNYMKLLEALFLIERLPAWGRTLRARAARLPKLHIVDTGLAARLLGLTPERLLRRGNLWPRSLAHSRRRRAGSRDRTRRRIGRRDRGEGGKPRNAEGHRTSARDPRCPGGGLRVRRGPLYRNALLHGRGSNSRPPGRSALAVALTAADLRSTPSASRA